MYTAWLAICARIRAREAIVFKVGDENSPEDFNRFMRRGEAGAIFDWLCRSSWRLAGRLNGLPWRHAASPRPTFAELPGTDVGVGAAHHGSARARRFSFGYVEPAPYLCSVHPIQRTSDSDCGWRTSRSEVEAEGTATGGGRLDRNQTTSIPSGTSPDRRTRSPV